MSRERVLLMTLVVMAIPVGAAVVTINVPGDQPTIQQGIDAASPGDTARVAPDTYTGALNRDPEFARRSAGRGVRSVRHAHGAALVGESEGDLQIADVLTVHVVPAVLAPTVATERTE